MNRVHLWVRSNPAWVVLGVALFVLLFLILFSEDLPLTQRATVAGGLVTLAALAVQLHKFNVNRQTEIKAHQARERMAMYRDVLKCLVAADAAQADEEEGNGDGALPSLLKLQDAIGAAFMLGGADTIEKLATQYELRMKGKTAEAAEQMPELLQEIRDELLNGPTANVVPSNVIADAQRVFPRLQRDVVDASTRGAEVAFDAFLNQRDEESRDFYETAKKHVPSLFPEDAKIRLYPMRSALSWIPDQLDNPRAHGAKLVYTQWDSGQFAFVFKLGADFQLPEIDENLVWSGSPTKAGYRWVWVYPPDLKPPKFKSLTEPGDDFRNFLKALAAESWRESLSRLELEES